MIEQLLKYQDVDAKLKAIEDSLKNSIEYKKYSQANKFLKTVNESRVMFEDRSGSLVSSFEDKQAELKKYLDEKAQLDESINGVQEDIDDKEAAYLSRRVQELQKMLASLEADLQKLSGDLNDIMIQYSNFCKKTKVAMEQNKEFKVKYEQLVQNTEKEKKEIEEELGKIEKDIPQNIMAKYKEKRKDGKFKIVCKVSDGYCSACGTELVIAEKEKLKEQKIIECANCHKLIYLE